MDTYVLGVDVWEGSLEVDKQVLWDAGVHFMIIRLNDMNGGHHMDENFTNQWNQAERFIRWPYFVYNPWVNQTENLRFLESALPPEVKHVSMDIEVRKPDYPPSEYARQVSGFINQACRKWSLDIYTGEWFLPYLSAWPQNVNYWCARYPGTFYPPKSRKLEWSELHTMLLKQHWAPGAMPGPVKLWQISGDRLCLPGCADRAMDINVFNGTIEELAAYAGVPVPDPNPIRLNSLPLNQAHPLPPPTFEPLPPVLGTLLMVTPTIGTAMNAKPDADSEIIGAASPGESFVVIERNLNFALSKLGNQEKWLYVQNQGGAQGWVPAWLVTTSS